MEMIFLKMKVINLQILIVFVKFLLYNKVINSGRV